MLKSLVIIICILFTSCNMREVKNSPETIINITVQHNQEILLNGEPVVIADISQKLIEFKLNDTINKRKLYVTHLNVAKNTDADLVMDIKQELRKAKLLKLHYTTY